MEIINKIVSLFGPGPRPTLFQSDLKQLTNYSLERIKVSYENFHSQVKLLKKDVGVLEVENRRLMKIIVDTGNKYPNIKQQLANKLLDNKVEEVYIMEMTAKKFRDPPCLTPDGIHIFEDSDGPFYAQCKICFERYLIISESMCREAGILSVSSEEGLVKSNNPGS